MTHSKQVALVTGSTSGIGLAIARKLASENYLVIQNSRNHFDNPELILDRHYIADVTIEEDCKKLVETITTDYGRLDVLVCNVGSGRPLLTETNKKEYWDHYLNVNFHSATLIIESALPNKCPIRLLISQSRATSFYENDGRKARCVRC